LNGYPANLSVQHRTIRLPNADQNCALSHINTSKREI
jgi:hypothetical protein